MKVLIFICLTLLLSNLALADDSTAWNNLIFKINTTGAFEPADNEIPASYKLRAIKGNINKTHTANYVNEWGFVDSETGEFMPSFVSFVYEQWKLSSDNLWYIDQWICASTMEGELYKISHTTLIETIDGQIKGYNSKELDSNSYESQQKFRELIYSWK